MVGQTDGMRRVAAACLLALFIGGCAARDEAPAADVLEPPTTFEGQPESLTTVPDDDSTTTTSTSPPTPTSITVPARTGVTASDLCAGAALIEPTPTIDTDLLPETSGVAYSRSDPTVMYAHNDSGNLPRLFGIGADSTVQFVWSIDGALFDWEDLAVVGPYVYLADFGDNLHIRPTVRLLEVLEPDGADATLTPTRIWSYTYENTRFDAEALIVDADGCEAVIVTKGLDAPATIFRLPLDEPEATAPSLRAVGTLDIGLVTAADVTADGAVVGLRTLDRILLWDRPAGEPIADVLLLPPVCEAPSAPERQGEAFAFHPDGRGYTTLSERESATRNDFRMGDS